MCAVHDKFRISLHLAVLETFYVGLLKSNSNEDSLKIKSSLVPVCMFFLILKLTMKHRKSELILSGHEEKIKC